ncbi:MAG: hypothetical protein ACRD0B_11535 [Acidimicrobiales bacterium]
MSVQTPGRREPTPPPHGLAASVGPVRRRLVGSEDLRKPPRVLQQIPRQAPDEWAGSGELGAGVGTGR